MLSLSKLALLVAMVTLMVTWVSQEAEASPLNSFPSTFDDRTRHDIITMAARIIKLAMSGRSLDTSQAKRNGGTLDTLYNLPNLGAIGRR